MKGRSPVDNESYDRPAKRSKPKNPSQYVTPKEVVWKDKKMNKL